MTKSTRITHYAAPHRVLATDLAKVVRGHLRSPGAPVVDKRILMEFVAGKSVGPPPAD